MEIRNVELFEWHWKCMLLQQIAKQIEHSQNPSATPYACAPITAVHCIAAWRSNTTSKTGNRRSKQKSNVWSSRKRACFQKQVCCFGFRTIMLTKKKSSAKSAVDLCQHSELIQPPENTPARWSKKNAIVAKVNHPASTQMYIKVNLYSSSWYR